MGTATKGREGEEVGRQRGNNKAAGGLASGGQRLKDLAHSHDSDGLITAPTVLLSSPALSSVHPPASSVSMASPKLAPTAALVAAASSASPSTLAASTAHSAHAGPSAAAASSSSAAAVPSSPFLTSAVSLSSASSSAAASLSSSPASSAGAPLPSSALLGILTHSAIDGLALGAISVSDDNASLELVVFLAIVLHKAPAAFGLSSFLLYQGRSRQETRWHLTVFSLAAPVTSVLTYLLFLQRSVLGGGGSGSGSGGGGGVSSEWLGLCLLFSAGTFLFTIAAHILPEVSRKEGEVMEWRYVMCLIIGILMPLALSTTHHH